MADYATAVRKATLEASRLHRDLAIQARAVHETGRVDVYDTIAKLDVPLVFTKLDGLLGVYLREPSPGILVTTERPQRQQRFTAAHELGHHYLGHNPSLDDDSILRREPFAGRAGDDLQEIEAEAFAAAFLLPQWLLDHHCQRQEWTDANLFDPATVYQLALRVGTSFLATVWTLHRYKVLDRQAATAMSKLKVKDIKQSMLRGYRPAKFKGDVWLVTEHDEGTRLHGGPDDLVVLRLRENSGAGYLWRIQSINGEALVIVEDGRDTPEPNGVGGETLRRFTAKVLQPHTGEIQLNEVRPWQPTASLNSFVLKYDLRGAEAQGWYKDQRREHRKALEAA